MKKVLKISMLLLACMLIVGVTDVDAQYGKKKKKKKKKPKTEKSEDKDYFDESGGFVHKLWYGGGLNLGFAGNNQESLFGIGVSPMVGYKITEELSIGPRLVLDYTTRRIDFNSEIYKADYASYGGGVFARFKAFRSIFFHTEFALINEAFPNGFLNPDNNKIIIERETSENFYIGGGYHSGGGGGFGYEIVLLYNVLEPDDTVNLPIDLRFGFTWGF